MSISGINQTEVGFMGSGTMSLAEQIKRTEKLQEASQPIDDEIAEPLKEHNREVSKIEIEQQVAGKGNNVNTFA